MAIVRGMGDGTAWPIPGREMADLHWSRRHGAQPDLIVASIIGAYEQLIWMPARARNKRISAIRKAANR